MLRDAVRGVAATGIMSVPMGARWLAQPGVPPPPMVIAERVQRALGLRPDRRNAVLRHATWIGAHFGFGATVGALARLWPTRMRARPWEQAYGVVVWAANYGIGLPALGLYPRPTRDARGRAAETFASHLVYAAALGALARRSNE